MMPKHDGIQEGTETCVIKLQWPLFVSHGQPMVLCYNEDKSIYAQFPTSMIQGALRRWLEEDLKGYVEGRINSEGQLVIDRCLTPEEEPSW